MVTKNTPPEYGLSPGPMIVACRGGKWRREGEWWRAAAAEAAAGFCCACRSGHLAACYAACEGAWHSLRRRGGHQAVRQGRGADLPVKQVISCRPRTARSGRVLLQVLQGGTESGGR
jgi:hypothetical protein